MADLEPQAGKTFLVTGGNSGTGFECVLHLARRGATVVIACRNAERGNDAVSRIQAALAGTDATPGGSVRLATIDLSDLASVKAGAATLNAAHTELHGLILNAGVMMLPRTLTADGQEMQMATNHLGHFALTGLLLPLLMATPGARVVSVSSDAQRHGVDLSLDDWTMEQGYSPTVAYVRSKAANMLFARELARRLAAAGSPVLAAAAQPGWCTTSLLVKATPELSTSIFIAGLKPFLIQAAEAGACCLLYAATEAGVATNDY